MYDLRFGEMDAEKSGVAGTQIINHKSYFINTSPMLQRLLLCLVLLSTNAFAQEPDPANSTPPPNTPVQASRPVWRCNLPGGNYEIVVAAMVSVSSHEYIVDGAARVTEVNVDTQGILTVRFYYIEPLSTPGGVGAATLSKVQSVLTEAADRTGVDAWRKVVKNYPTTTHAKTVEYRLGSKESLTKVLNSASKCLRTGQADEVTISQ